MLHQGRFEVSCDLTAGGSQTFTIVPPPPPEEAD
jgi:hypothetical protein